MLQEALRSGEFAILFHDPILQVVAFVDQVGQEETHLHSLSALFDDLLQGLLQLILGKRFAQERFHPAFDGSHGDLLVVAGGHDNGNQ